MSKTPSGPNIWLALIRATGSMDRVAKQSMSEAGLGFTDFVMLEALMHLGPLTPGVLGDKVGLTSGSVTAAIDRLEARGLLERSSNPADQRSRIVKITDAGRAVIEPAYRRHARDIEQLVSGALTAGQRSELFALLRTLQKSAEEWDGPSK
jgi:MarR family 2-MHQ and catechol resistance regulon transcriptional repressor